MEMIFSYLPNHIQNRLRHVSTSVLNKVEEIRLRVDRSIELNVNDEVKWVDYIFTREDCDFVLDKITNYSIYTMDEQLQKGFITIVGGHRVGLAGKVVVENGKVRAIRTISSLNIRIAREKIGVINPLIDFLYDQNKWQNTMIIGPPQSGKTTLLRDLARFASSSNQKQKKIQAVKVGVVDERSEITSSLGGVPQLTFGERIDVLDNCPKAEGMMMFIRSLSPQLLIVDEIGSTEESEAVVNAVHAGISLAVTVHGNHLKDVQARPMLKKLFQMHTFERYIEVVRRDQQMFYVKVLNESGGIIHEQRMMKK